MPERWGMATSRRAGRSLEGGSGQSCRKATRRERSSTFDFEMLPSVHSLSSSAPFPRGRPSGIPRHGLGGGGALLSAHSPGQGKLLSGSSEGKRKQENQKEKGQATSYSPLFLIPSHPQFSNTTRSETKATTPGKYHTYNKLRSSYLST